MAVIDTSAPRIDIGRDAAPVGYHRFTDDVSINFQCNRWVQWIGASAMDEVTGLGRRATTYPQWIDGYLRLAEDARGADQPLKAAYHDRAAEFFMPAGDARRTAARARFVDTLQTIYGVTSERVPYGYGSLPAYDLCPQRQKGTPILMFGGFDSYIEEFFPMVAALVEWERPVAAVLDHYDLADVTAVGISLGGGLVIRAAAFEPRITRAVAFDILDEFREAVARQIRPGLAAPLRVLLNLQASALINALATRAAALRPVSQWGLQQGMRVTGTATPYDFLRAILGLSTRAISHRVTGDVLLLAGADDHYVPLSQLGRQAANLTGARSVTTRTFTAAEQASNHVQVGNIGLALRVILAWLDQVEPRRPTAAPRAG
jgi:pimeloyl-ACP methyl ester carboxylesterase